MLVVIAKTVAVAAVGAYLLNNDAKSNNKRARKEYNNTYSKSKKQVKNAIFHAQRKDALDKLFKMKRAKQKVADAIYSELKKLNKDFKKINKKINASKETLAELFEQKRATEDRAEKRRFQEEINTIQSTRKEFFIMKDDIVKHQKELKARLKLANQETRMVQDEINHILDDN